MKMLIKRIMQLACVDARRVFMSGKKLLQCTNDFPVIRPHADTLASRDLGRGLLRPAWWRVRETFLITCL
jgi:hypothetical protein